MVALLSLNHELIKGLTLAAILVTAYFAVLWLCAVIWTYRDIEARTTDRRLQTVSVLMVTFLSVPGLLLYFAIRPPEQLVESYNRQLEAEAFLHEIEKTAHCLQCRRAVQETFIACPYCRATLQSTCVSCNRDVKSTWVLCPYCATERDAETAERQAARTMSGPLVTASGAGPGAMSDIAVTMSPDRRSTAPAGGSPS